MTERRDEAREDMFARTLVVSVLILPMLTILPFVATWMMLYVASP